MTIDMKSIIKKISPIIDFFLFPYVFLSAFLLLVVRKIGLQRLKVSKKILMKIGVFPIREHYFEPMFNPKHLRYSLRKDRELSGMDFNIEEQLKILSKFHYNEELLKFPLEKKNDKEFYYHNGSFESGDTEYLYNIIRLKKPRRMIEIGSGNSTLIAIRAIYENKCEDINYICEHICIEPYEKPWLDQMQIKVVRERVEEMDKNVFLQLGNNDILFIDSSHVIRPQGDVLFEYLEILPIIKSGVLIHIHDIFTPKDYLDRWVMDEVRFFNEQYLLEAFLIFNKEYEIIGSLNYLMHHYFEEISSKCPVLKNEPYRNSSSFWIKKV